MGFWKTENEIEFTSFKTDYEGIAKVLSRFTELYKVCDNKELLDKHLDQFFLSLNQRLIYDRTRSNQ